MKLIVAKDLNNGIGINNTLPWKCKEDLQWFKQCTENRTVVMGRNTFESLGSKGLPNRFNIVITTVPDSFRHLSSDTLVFMTLNDYVKTVHKESDWLIGGATLYKVLLPYVNEAYITTIQDTHECDTYLDIDFTNCFTEMHEFSLSKNASVTTYWRKD